MAQESQTPVIVKVTEEEYNQRLNNPDKKEALGFINQVLSGQVAVGEREPVSATPNPDSVAQGIPPTAQTVNVSNVQPVSGITSSESTATDASVKPTEQPVAQDDKHKQALLDEVNRKQQELDNLRDEQRKAREQSLAAEREREDELQKLREAHKRLEDELRVMRDTRVASQPTVEDESEAAYASRFSKQNRQMITKLQGELRTKHGSQTEQELLRKLQKLEEWERQQEATAKQEAARKRSQTLFNDIRNFQKDNPEYATPVDIEELDKQYIQFKQRMTNVFDVKPDADLEMLLYEYFNGRSTKADQIRERATIHGVEPPEGNESYRRIAELVDMKNGYEFDSITGKLKPILDEFGEPVRYRTVGDAYKVKYYFDDLNRARKEAAKELSEKLNTRQHTAVTVDNSQTSAETPKMTEDQVRQLLALKPQDYEFNPKLKAQVHAAYRMVGVEPPQRSAH